MINRQKLLADLQKLLQRIEADLLERSESTEVPEVPAALHAEYEKAAKAERTAQNYEDWRTDTITQAAAAWVLSCVFVRFLEDNSLIDPPKMSGPLSLVTGHSRLQRARDEHELYFRKSPQHSDREYLLSIFNELKKLPGTRELFTEFGKQLSVTNDKGRMTNDQIHWLSGDAAGELLNFFQKIDASTGELVHDFTDPNRDTRFLGDLYQDLSEAARKKFALLQTPDFVEEFILDRTLEPAIDEFGLVPQPSGDEEPTVTRFKMIDPACGSGHFLLGAFPRLLEHWQRKEPSTNIRELTQRALDSIHGVDINPFAVAIAKFRLLLASINVCKIQRLEDSPAFHFRVACGDSLLHGVNRTSTGQDLMDFAEGATDQELYSHAYPGEDLQVVRELLQPGRYHCVVANPPYIVPKDRKINDWYRKRYSACGGKYSLSVPFMQQIFELAVKKGFTGQITANSFMKREFGKRLIENFIPTIELTHVVDTSGAYIPGHGTPTVIVFGRACTPRSTSLRTVLGIRGEPSTPDTPSRGLVWTSITQLIDLPNQESMYVSAGDSDRALFHKHPWSIGGGGAAELKVQIDSNCGMMLKNLGQTAIGCVVLEEEIYVRHTVNLLRNAIPQSEIVGFVEGEDVRDWAIDRRKAALFPHSWSTRKPQLSQAGIRLLWPHRTCLANRLWFGKKQTERGLQWYEFGMLSGPVLASKLSIVFCEISTHNHFVLDRGNCVFTQTAPVIKLQDESNEDDYLALLGLLNSSVAGFWLKQISNCKGLGGQGGGIKPEDWHRAYAFNGTKLLSFPLPDKWRESLPIARQCETLAQLISKHHPESVLKEGTHGLRQRMLNAERETSNGYAKLVALQEELDWLCYGIYTIEDFVPASSLSLDAGLHPQDRPVEVLLRDQVANGNSSIFYDVHQYRGADKLEAPHKDMESTIKDRLQKIVRNPDLQLIETPNYKRRWQIDSWESKVQRAVREWLQLRLDIYFDFDERMATACQTGSTPFVRTILSEIGVYSVAQLADAARRDPQFMEVGELFRDDPAFDVQALVEELVAAESVPHLPILRYKDSGLRKRAEWEKTWDLQRREDAGESVSTIPVPPKYTSADFISTGGARYWSLRGKLDVPKERWISFPHCEGPDGTLVICWAGYDHLQQAQAISAYYVRVQTEFGGSDDPRLIPLLASLIELLPWLKQWHNEPNANFDGLRMGDYFEGFVNEEA
ncbi:MAG: BREX-2 system adenine-specific DNA-methyltransferase PglX, partial [Pirellula sp.]